MILDSFVPIGKILNEIIDETKLEISEDFYQNRWRSIFGGGKILFEKHNFLDEKRACQKIISGTRFKELEKIFFENDNLQKEDLSEFIQTYFYKINKYEFNEDVFRQTCTVLDQRIERKYSKKTFFFIPLWSFNSVVEFSIGEFALRKITPSEFDLVNSIVFLCKDESPILNHFAHDLKYVLEFNIVTPTQHFDPLEFAHIVLDALRILKTGDVNFGTFYEFQPENWRHMTGRPADPEPKNQFGKKMEYYEKDKSELERIFSELHKLDENGRCEKHSSTRDDCKACEKKLDRGRYIRFAIRRFQYIHDQDKTEDQITDLTISLEALLNRDQGELTEKISKRGGILLGTTTEERKEIRDFIKECYAIRSEIVHAKKRQRRDLGDKEIKNKLENHVREAIKKTLVKQNNYNDHVKILQELDDAMM